MNYSTYSTATIVKLLDRAAAGSAEQRALQEELRAREERRRDRWLKDTGTPLLFKGMQI